MTGWVIFGCVIAVLALLLSLSLVIRVEMDDGGLQAWMGIGPFGVQLLPSSGGDKDTGQAEQGKSGKKAKKAQKSAGKKKSGGAKKAKGKETEETAPAEKKPGDLLGTVRLVLAAAQGALPPLGKILSGFRLTDLRLYISVGGPDAAQTAVRYGQVCAVVHGSLAALKHFMRISVTDLQIGYDYLSGSIQQSFSFRLKLRLGRALGQLLRLAFRVLGRILRVMIKNGNPRQGHHGRPAAASEKQEE